MKTLVSIALLLVTLPSGAAGFSPPNGPAEAGPSTSRRPRIGVALGGGGARGAAHIAVLRTLEELHVPVDYVAGTSMGAVVGGMYASGMTPDEIEQALTTIDWRDALTDRTKYKNLAYRRKEDDNRYLTALEAGLRGGHITLPSGLRSAQKLRFLLQTYLVPAAGTRDFSRLPVPFKAVAADIETGEPVVLDHGDLAESIRASMSIPGVFTPVEIDGKLLVDGGVADNVPVDVVRAMGADVVIAVDVGSPLMKREQLGSYLAVTAQVLTILTRQNAQQQLANADVVLAPPVSSFPTMAFEDAGKIIAAAETYTRGEAPRLAPLAVPAEEYAEAAKARARTNQANRTIDYLGIEGSRRVDSRVVKSHVATRPGQPVDPETLRRDVTRIYGMDDFQEVTYSLRDDGDQHGLVLNLKDKPWGPTYVRFGINLTDDLQGESVYGLVASVTKTRMNALGAEWRTDLRLGHEFGVVSELYQPLDFRGHFFVAPRLQLTRSKFSFYDGGRRLAVFNLDERLAAVDLGMQFNDWGALRAGIYRGRVHAGVGAGDIDLPDGRVDSGGVHATLNIVRTDSPTIPREGSVVTVEYLGSRHGFGARDEYSKLSASATGALSRGRQTLFFGGAGGTNLGSRVPVYDQFSLGGLLNLGGFAPGQIHGERFVLARLGTYRQVRTLPSEFGTGVYIAAFTEMGNAWLEGERDREMHRSNTLGIAADTIIGPVLLAYARSDTGVGRFYVTVGKTF